MVPLSILQKQMVQVLSDLCSPYGSVAILVSMRDSFGLPLVAYRSGSYAALSGETAEQVVELLRRVSGLPSTHQHILNLKFDGKVIGRVEYHFREISDLGRIDVGLSQRDVLWAARVLGTALTAEQHERNATLDPLTGLPNRRAFDEALDRELERARRSEQGLATVALFLIDVDNFKPINDTRGHQAGDMALQRVAEALRANARRMDVPARWAGDEFALIAPDVTPEEAIELADRIRGAVAADGQITLSIGIAIAPNDAGDMETLVCSADRALYEAKAAGRNCIRLFNPIPSRHTPSA